MPRFFVKPEQIINDKVTIRDSDVRHLTRVLRLGPGDLITVFDGLGQVYRTEITEIGREAVDCRVLTRESAVGKPSLKVTLVQGLPKGDKMELIVQKCTELGIDRIIPLQCHRSVVRLEGKKALERQARWQKVAQEAAKQCGRPDIPVVSALADWSGVLAALPADCLKLMPWEKEDSQALKGVLRQEPKPAEVCLFIGPEGGFELDEVVQARARGVHMVSMGSRILRTETAGLTALTMVMYEWGDLGGAML